MLCFPHTVDGYNGFYFAYQDKCHFSSWNLSDLEFIKSVYFNKIEFLRFNSTVGKYIGHTPYGELKAGQLNNDSTHMAIMRAQKEIYCKPRARNDINKILTKKGEYKLRKTIHSVINQTRIPCVVSFVVCFLSFHACRMFDCDPLVHV